MSIILAPVSQNDVEFFREPRILSGYSHVYPHPKGRLWVSYAFKHQVRIGSDPTPRGAAFLVAGWWKKTFGECWREVYSSHRKPAWKVVRNKDDSGFRLCVWEFGRQKWLPPDNPKLDCFRSADDAYDHFARWKKDRYGIFEPVIWFFLRRHQSEDYERWVMRGRRVESLKRGKRPSPTPCHPFFAEKNS